MTNKNEQRKVPELRFPEFSGEWDFYKLADVLKSKGEGIRRGPFGGALKKEIFRTEGYAIYEQRNAIYDHQNFRYFIDSEKYNEMKSFKVVRNDIIMSCSGTIGKLSLISNEYSEGIINQALIRFRTNEKILPLYFILYMRSQKMQRKLLESNPGSAITNLIPVKELRNLEFPLPSISEQQKIGEFFSKLDRQIELEEKKLALLEEQKKGYMQKIFSQELRFKDEKGEEYPEWELKSISEISSVITKGTTPKNYDNNGGVNFIKVESIDETGEIVITSKIDYHTHVNDLKRSILKPGDILFSIAGSIGKTIIIKEENLPANTNQALAIIRIDNENIQYINYFLISKKNKILKENISTIGAQPNLSLKQISNIKIDLPCNLEKQIISQFFYKLESKIKAQTNKVVKYKERKVSLISKIFI